MIDGAETALGGTLQSVRWPAAWPPAHRANDSSICDVYTNRFPDSRHKTGAAMFPRVSFRPPGNWSVYECKNGTFRMSRLRDSEREKERERERETIVESTQSLSLSHDCFIIGCL